MNRQVRIFPAGVAPIGRPVRAAFDGWIDYWFRKVQIQASWTLRLVLIQKTKWSFLCAGTESSLEIDRKETLPN